MYLKTGYEEMVRTFIALEASNPGVKEYVKSLQGCISQVPVRMSLVDPDIVHITLKFLGEMPEERVSRVEEGLERIDFKPFTFEVKEVGFLPNRKEPRVIFLDVEKGVEKLVELASLVEGSLASLGFPRDARSFTPHITVARIKTPWRAQNLVRVLETFPTRSIDVEAREIKLKKSTLTPRGPIYEDLYVKVLGT